MTAGIPKGKNTRIAAIEPASAHPHLFLCMAYTPPTRASIAAIVDTIAIPRTRPGTNAGIYPVGIFRAPLVTPKPINKQVAQISSRAPVITHKIPAFAGLFVFSIFTSLL